MLLKYYSVVIISTQKTKQTNSLTNNTTRTIAILAIFSILYSYYLIIQFYVSYEYEVLIFMVKHGDILYK